MRPIYLDNAATTPLDPAVFDVMARVMREDYGNASSVHGPGRQARYHVETSRERVAALLGAEPSEIIFTSGGTEANNLALRGGRPEERPGLIISAAEHEAVLGPAERLREEGAPVTFLSPDNYGRVAPAQVDDALTDEVGLVSIMYANNEVGTLSDVAGIADVCHNRGARLHCDAVQAAGLYGLKVDELGVDMLTMSGHKFYGPKGAGVLYARGGVELTGQVEGGGQERGRRGGTENVAAIVGLAEALERACGAADERFEQSRAMRNRLNECLLERLGERFILNTPLAKAPVAPHILNISFPPVNGVPVDGEMLLLNLDMQGVCASAGSACASGALEPSHVLLAMGVPRHTAVASIRFSIGKDTSPDEVDRASEAVASVIEQMTSREKAPV